MIFFISFLPSVSLWEMGHYTAILIGPPNSAFTSPGVQLSSGTDFICLCCKNEKCYAPTSWPLCLPDGAQKNVI